MEQYNHLLKILQSLNNNTIKDTIFMNEFSNHFEIQNKNIGKGSFGVVYKCLNDKMNPFAIKCSIFDKNNPKNIIEICIMSSILHPNINRSYYAFINNKKSYIIQELAISDLHSYIHKDEYVYDLNLIKEWMFQILFAIYTLHKLQIIHGDIKTNNILIYDDNTVKLTDFSLSTIKINKNQKFNFIICTINYCPIECLLGLEWNELIDMWSLGCVYYELIYLKTLFETQQNNNKLAYYNAIIHLNLNNENLFRREFNLPFQKIKLSKDFNNSNNIPYNLIIKKLLYIDVHKRISSSQLIKDKFFHSFHYKEKKNKVFILNKYKNILTLSDSYKIHKIIKDKNINDEYIKSYIFDICKKINKNIFEKLNDIIIYSVIDLVFQLISPNSNNIFYITDAMHEIQNKICNYLNFRLLYVNEK